MAKRCFDTHQEPPCRGLIDTDSLGRTMVLSPLADIGYGQQASVRRESKGWAQDAGAVAQWSLVAATQVEQFPSISEDTSGRRELRAVGRLAPQFTGKHFPAAH